MKILGIAEIVINVNDLPLVRDFYVELLGFEVSGQSEHENPNCPIRPGEPTICFLRVAGGDTPLARAVHPPFLVLIDYKRHSAARSKFKEIDQSKSIFNHMAFEIEPEDYLEWVKRCKSKNLEVFETKFENVNAIAMFISDPEGNSVELICNLQN